MKMINRINILQSNIDNVSMAETLSVIEKSIENGNELRHVVVNAGKIVSMQTDAKLRESVNNADLINADGMAVVWASRILNKPLKERVSGIDIMKSLVEMAYLKKYRVFFFGASESVVKKVVDTYSQKYSPSIIAGYRNGYFVKSEESDIAHQIASSGADILFVAISSPIKENFLYENKEILKSVDFTMGVGGSFDVVSGLVKRAPMWMQKLGLEWFYRLIQEPKRMWKRYLIGNVKFMYLVSKEKSRLNRCKNKING